MKQALYLTFCILFISLHFTSCIQDSVEDVSKDLSVSYNGSSVQVDNPMAKYGVSIKTEGAHVVVTSVYDGEDIRLKVSGTSANGSLKIYSRRRFQLTLNGLNLTNPNGPVVNIQGKKHVTVDIPSGMDNSLTDGLDYPAEVLVNNFPEEQSAAFFSEGGLYFQGSGSLTVLGRGALQHAIASDDKIQVEGVTLFIHSSSKDGIHTNDGYSQFSGRVTVQSNGDGIDAGSTFFTMSGGELNLQCDSADSKAIACDSTLTVSGGNLNIQVNGDQGKGLKAGKTIFLTGGEIVIQAMGNVALTPLNAGFDPSYCAAIKSDADILLDGASVEILHSGSAGRGISAGTDFTMLSGMLNIVTSGDGAAYIDSTGVQDAYSAVCISTDRDIYLLGGSLNANSQGLGGKCISTDSSLVIGSALESPTITLRSSGQAIYSGVVRLSESKVVKCDGDVRIVNGRVFLDAAGFGEALDAGSSINMEGGMLVAQGPANGTLVKTLDYENQFVITGGTLMASGPYRTEIPLPTSETTQNYLYARAVTTSSFLPAEALLTLKDSTAHVEFSYRPIRNAYFFLYSSSAFQQNMTYTLFTGGTISDGLSLNGLYLDGSFMGGRIKMGFTPTRVTTNVVFQPQPL